MCGSLALGLGFSYQMTLVALYCKISSIFAAMGLWFCPAPIRGRRPNASSSWRIYEALGSRRHYGHPLVLVYCSENVVDNQIICIT